MKEKQPFGAITLRGVPADVAQIIRKRSSESGESVNKVVLELLEAGAGTGRKRRKIVHHDLDALFGAWSRTESAAFDRELAEERRPDWDVWR